jgi:hypothetical protein
MSKKHEEKTRGETRRKSRGNHRRESFPAKCRPARKIRVRLPNQRPVPHTQPAHPRRTRPNHDTTQRKTHESECVAASPSSPSPSSRSRAASRVHRSRYRKRARCTHPTRDQRPPPRRPSLKAHVAPIAAADLAGPQTDTDGGLAADVPQARFADAGASPPVCWRGDADDDQRVADEILGAQLQQASQSEAADRLADQHDGPITCSINLAATPVDTVRALVPAPAVYAYALPARHRWHGTTPPACSKRAALSRRSAGCHRPHEPAMGRA